MRETDNLGAVEETETGGEPEPSLVRDHPEHDDDLVAEAQWVFHLLEVDKLEGVQKQQPMQEKPGEAETQKDEVTVAQWLPPHHIPKIHQENEGIGQDPHCKLQGRKEQKCTLDFIGHSYDRSQSQHVVSSYLVNLRLTIPPSREGSVYIISQDLSFTRHQALALDLSQSECIKISDRKPRRGILLLWNISWYARAHCKSRRMMVHFLGCCRSF